MFWLSLQTWLCYLIAFAAGVLVSWVLLVRPQQHRLRAAQSAPADLADAGRPEARPAPEPDADALSGAALFAPRVPEPVTERFPVVVSGGIGLGERATPARARPHQDREHRQDRAS